MKNGCLWIVGLFVALAAVHSLTDQIGEVPKSTDGGAGGNSRHAQPNRAQSDSLDVNIPVPEPTKDTSGLDKPLMPDNPNGNASQIQISVEKEARISLMFGQAENSCVSNFIDQVPGKTTRRDAINGAVKKCTYLIQEENGTRAQNNLGPDSVSDQAKLEIIEGMANQKMEETFGPA